MALTGPYYWDGTHFPMQSGKPVLISQSDFEDCCCAAVPCTDCLGGSQDDIVVSNTSGCIVACRADGTYTYSTIYTYFPVGDCLLGDCRWVWALGPPGDNAWRLLISYTTASNTWTAQLRKGRNACYESTAYFESNDVSGLLCNKATGKLEGTFSLPGISTCTGCTANLSIST